MTWKQEAIEQIDAIFEWLLKVDKWDKMANRLSKLLLGKWNETQKAAIYNALELLGSGTVTKDSLNDVLGSLERSLGKNLADAMREPVATVQTDSYHLAGKDIGVDFEFNRPDRKALDWLERDAMYWIGTHYDRNLRRSMEDSAQEVIRQGMGRLEATAHLKSVFGERFGKADGYWEGLSNHIVTRAREFGRVSAYDQAGVKYFKVIAYLDHRTSSMCRAMNGRIISVDVARAQRDAMMAAKTPEDAKKIAPWYTDKEVKAKVEGKPSGKLPKAVGLPPYHFNCRTRTVIAEEGEKEHLKPIDEQTPKKPEAAIPIVPTGEKKKPDWYKTLTDPQKQAFDQISEKLKVEMPENFIKDDFSAGLDLKLTPGKRSHVFGDRNMRIDSDSVKNEISLKHVVAHEGGHLHAITKGLIVPAKGNVEGKPAWHVSPNVEEEFKKQLNELYKGDDTFDKKHEKHKAINKIINDSGTMVELVNLQRKINEKHNGKYTILETNRFLNSVADYFGAMTKNKIGWGHDDGYYKNYSFQATEMFAHHCENYYIGNPVFELLFPRHYKMTIDAMNKFISGKG